MQELTDLDKMPFGKHKGQPMCDIPASYFHWLWTNGKEQYEYAERREKEFREKINPSVTIFKKSEDGIW